MAAAQQLILKGLEVKQLAVVVHMVKYSRRRLQSMMCALSAMMSCWHLLKPSHTAGTLYSNFELT